MGGRGLRTMVQPTKLAHMSRPYRGTRAMDIDLATSGLERIAGSDPPLDTIAHGLYFGEGPVWDRRNRRFLWTDIIADTIWQWTPGAGKQIVIQMTHGVTNETLRVGKNAVGMRIVGCPAEALGAVVFR